MTIQNQSENDPKPSTSSQDHAGVKTPPEIERQLTDAELATISGGPIKRRRGVGPSRSTPKKSDSGRRGFQALRFLDGRGAHRFEFRSV